MDQSPAKGSTHANTKAASTPTLIGCTLLSNSAKFGGGVYGASVLNSRLAGNRGWNGGAANSARLTDCTLSDNWATNGGGACLCTLVSCLVVTNSAVTGGGIADGTTINCTVVGNHASTAGGVKSGEVHSSIVYFNSAQAQENYDSNASWNHCCTTPLPLQNYYRNFTNDPLFADPDRGDFNLLSNSPCINGGDNFFATQDPDRAGNPRAVAGTVDVGAFEFQHPGSVISYHWLHQYGLPTDGSADYAEPDGDGMNNWQEWRSSTDPKDSASLLRIRSLTNTPFGARVTWQGVDGRYYSLYRATDLSSPQPFLQVGTNLFVWNGLGVCNDPKATGSGPFFYRISVDEVPSP
jgi:hypothetical protein